MNFTFKGIKSEDMGVTVLIRPEFVTAESRMTFIDPDGYEGSVTQNNGYQSYTTEMTIVTQDNIDLEAVRGWLQGEGVFTRSDYKNKYIKVAFLDGIDYQYIAGELYQSTITMTVVDPYWYEVGETIGEESVFSPVYKNIIKDDFSDFIPFRGAEVVKNKTFPVEYFKGGRNLQINSTYPPTLGPGTTTIEKQLPNGFIVNYKSTSSTPYIIMQVIRNLDVTKELTISFKVKNLDDVARNLRYGLRNGTIADQTTTVEPNEEKEIKLTDTPAINQGALIIYPQVAESRQMITDIKVEVGNDVTEWSPAPEDGYLDGATPYHGVDAGYHIQSQGGFDSTKYYCPGSAISGDFGMGVNVKNFGSHNIDVTSTSKSVTVQPNQHANTEQRFSNATYPVDYSFDTQVASRDLDIVASGPYLWVNPSLIKGDFSDFTPFQGAVVTRNKTFPIDVFKGGRNYLLNTSSTMKEVTTLPTTYFYQKGSNIKLKLGDVLTISVETKGVTGSLEFGVSRVANAFQKDMADYNYNVGLVENGKTTRTITIRESDLYETGDTYLAIRVRPRANTLPITYFVGSEKIEKGAVSTDYSPAPEDGYDYQGIDGAYHIQTSGGEHSIKYQYAKSNTDDNELLTQVTTHAFNEMRIYNGNVQKILPLNETYIYDELDGNGVRIDFQFRTVNNVNVDLPLDFIASDPQILEEEGTYGIVNIGNIEATPVLRLIYISGPSSKEFKIGDNYLTYDFPAGEKYVDYDTRTGFPEYEGSRRDRHLSLETETFTIPTGTTLVQYEEGSEIEVSRESRWR